MSSQADAIDALLPQTQCQRCGYRSCRDYAEALAQGWTSINRCPPGGEATIKLLSNLLQLNSIPLDSSCGTSGPHKVALIDEDWCIGCTICIKTCPVDAIVGAAKHMHTVLARECTGCELCVQPCPTDCIEMCDVTSHPQSRQLSPNWSTARAGVAKHRFYARNARQTRLQGERATRIKRAALRHADVAAKQLAIEAAVARSKASRKRGDHE